MTVLANIQPLREVGRESMALRREARREAVVRAAAAVFGLGGYAAMSMEDVARALGTSKPTLYRLFKNKEELMFACHKTALDVLYGYAQNAETMNGGAIERLHYFLRRMLELMTEDLGRAYLGLEESHLNDRYREEAKAARREVQMAVRRIVRSGIEAGEIRADIDPKFVALTLFGAVNGAALWFSHEGPKSAVEIADAIMSMVTDGVKSKSVDFAQGRTR